MRAVHDAWRERTSDRWRAVCNDASLMDLPARASEVELLLGDVDPSVIARILETGASIAEVDEALRSIEDDVGFGERSHEPSTSRVAEVRAILDELARDDAAEVELQ